MTAGPGLRDPRILVHGVVTNRRGEEGEFKVRGQARSEKDSGVQRRYADAVAQALGWKPEPEHFHLFAIDIDSFSYLRYRRNDWGPVRDAMAAGP